MPDREPRRRRPAVRGAFAGGARALRRAACGVGWTGREGAPLIVVLGGISARRFPVRLVAGPGRRRRRGRSGAPSPARHGFHRRSGGRGGADARATRPIALCAVLDALGVDKRPCRDRRLLWRDDRARSGPAFPGPGRAAGGDLRRRRARIPPRPRSASSSAGSLRSASPAAMRTRRCRSRAGSPC